MKKHFLILLMLISLFQFGYSQVPSAIPYQAVVRNGNGNILPNHPVQLRFSIHDSITNGNVVYQETHSISTNGQGLVITNIGQGTSTTGTFSGINWGKNNKFVQTELSINNDNSFTDLGTTQFLSVPYALHSKTSENGMPNGNSDGEMFYWSNGKWVKVAPGGYGQPLVMCDGVPSWGGCLPKLTTSNITLFYTGGGNISSDGGTSITARGVCYSTSPNPTISQSFITTDGNSIGSFTSYLTGLSFNTTYYVRAYATNSVGTAYGNEVSFTTDFSYSGDWKIVSASVWLSNGSASQQFDILNDTSFYARCEIDDIYNFLANGQYVYIDAGVSCGNGNGSGTWSISNNLLTIDNNTDTITNFTANSFETASPTLSFNDTDYSTTPPTITTYYYRFYKIYARQ